MKISLPQKPCVPVAVAALFIERSRQRVYLLADLGQLEWVDCGQGWKFISVQSLKRWKRGSVRLTKCR